MLCPECLTRTMQRRVGVAAVTYECSCGHVAPGTSESRLIRSGVRQAISTAEKYGTVIACAPFSRTMLRVKEPCKSCGLPYLTQVKVGDDETIFRVCECGYRTNAAD